MILMNMDNTFGTNKLGNVAIINVMEEVYIYCLKVPLNISSTHCWCRRELKGGVYVHAKSVDHYENI